MKKDFVKVSKVSEALYGDKDKMRSNILSKCHKKIIDTCNEAVSDIIDIIKGDK